MGPVQLTWDAGVATITLDSPQNRNALSSALVAGVHEALDQATDAACRAIVLAHTPPVFCAGADLKERSARGGAAGVNDAFVSLLQRLMRVPQPTIAAVQGPVRAGGIGLMAACDLVVVAPDVTFAFTEVRIGVAPAIISVPILRRVPPAHLTAAFLTGRTFDAAHAERVGLVDVVAEDVAATVHDLCDGILAAAPGAVAATKRLLHEVPDLGVEEGFARMGELSSTLFASDEAAEGMAAFLERRPPRWAEGSP